MLALCGCSASEGGTAVHGTVRGNAIHIADAVSGPVHPSTDAMGYAEILLSTASDVCSDAAANTFRPDQTTVDILLANSTPTAELVPSMTGTYMVGGGPLRAVVIVRSYDAQCQVAATSMSSAVSGAVNLTAITGNTFDGTFDVVLDTQDHITGSFAPTECLSLRATSAGATCM